MRFVALVALAALTACTPVWSTHAQTTLASPAPMDCVHWTLLLQDGIDTTAILVNRPWPSGGQRIGYVLEGEEQPQPLQELGFAGHGGGGHFIQQPGPTGAARIEVYWQWNGERPGEDSVRVVEKWLRNYIVTMCRECVAVELDPERDILISRSWAEPREP